MAEPADMSVNAMLLSVADQRGYFGNEKEVWVDAVAAKLWDIRVITLRDFIENSYNLNRDLCRSCHKQIHHTTLTMMLAECCEMIYGPDGA
jgi:hypothetical protein